MHRFAFFKQPAFLIKQLGVYAQRARGPLSQRSWQESSTVVNAIQSHPFNQKMMNGTLDKKQFGYYIEQDIHYLKTYSQANAIMASRIDSQYAAQFKQSANYTGTTEQQNVHQVFIEQMGIKMTGVITPATRLYSQHLLQSVQHDPIPIAIASLLPCYWIYLELGYLFAKNSPTNNPYAPWFNTYSSVSFRQATHEKIKLFDTFGAAQHVATQTAMKAQFRKSLVFEWHFWNDAYHQHGLLSPQKQPNEVQKNCGTLPHIFLN